MSPFTRRIYRVVGRIPRGRVSTYGVVARLAGKPGAARAVGWALAALPDDADVPWWRVINAAGRVPQGGRGHGALLQRALLQGEGVGFDVEGAVSLGARGWPRGAYPGVAGAAPPHTRAASSRRSRRLNGLRT